MNLGILMSLALLGACEVRGLPRLNIQQDDAIPGEYLIGIKRENLGRIDGMFKESDVLGRFAQKRHEVFRIRANTALLDTLAASEFVDIIESNRMLQAIRPVDVEKASNHRVRPAAGSGGRETVARSSGQECNEQYEPAPDIWGLKRTSYHDLPDYTTDPYMYYHQGEGVDIYILDSGVDFTHPDLEGRGELGFVSAEIEALEGSPDRDGHGSNVASISGGREYGMAKQSFLYSVKVLGILGGSTSGIISGIEWSVANMKSRGRPGVLNLSLGGNGTSEVMNAALQDAADDGAIILVAAGNDAQDANGHMPANAPAAITVGATDEEDNFAEFSNFGDRVDLSAPGVRIYGAYRTTTLACRVAGRENCIYIVSGTSQATPHVTGAVARYLSSLPLEDALSVRQEDIRQLLTVSAIAGRITFNDTIHLEPTVNLLLYAECLADPADNSTTTLSPVTTTTTATTTTTSASTTTTATTTLAPTSTTTTTTAPPSPSTSPATTTPIESTTKPATTATTTATTSSTSPPCTCPSNVNGVPSVKVNSLVMTSLITLLIVTLF